MDFGREQGEAREEGGEEARGNGGTDERRRGFDSAKKADEEPKGHSVVSAIQTFKAITAAAAAVCRRENTASEL